MRIKSLYIKNFFSIQEINLEFDDNGIICIEGKNKDSGGSIGSGKSSIFEAIVWGLFGRTIRKSVQDSLVNTKAGKECEVVVGLDDGVEIQRVVKPPYLQIKIDNKVYIKESYQDTQKFIEDKLNINYKSFLVANVFGQQNELDFISASLEDKRLMLKTFLGLEEFFSLRDKFKNKKTEIINKLKSIEFTCESTRKIVEKAEKNIIAATKNSKDIKTKFNLTDSYKLEDILIKEREVRDLYNDANDYGDKVFDLELKLKASKKELKDNDDFNVCSECGSSLDEKPIGWERSCIDEIKSLESQIQGYNSKISTIKSNIERIKIPISSSDYHKIKDIELYDSEINLNTKLKTEHEEILKQEGIRKEKNAKYLDILKFWESVFSEQGIVKYIIHNVLDHFNNRCMHYLSILTNGKATIKFNDSFEEAITINGQVTYYNSLSGGERKKINFAVLLALQSLLDFTSKAKFDFILLDEVVESIDDESVGNFFTLLNELSKNKVIFVISHNSALKEYLVNKRKIKLVKSKGITKLEK